MSVDLEITPDEKGLQGIRESLAGLPKAAEVTFDRLAQEIGQSVIKQVSAAVGAVRTPLNWTSDAQEGEYYRTKGFGRGIPTKRTGNTRKSFKSVTETRGDYRMWIFSNTAPGSEYVYGKLHHDLTIAAKYQQRFHRDTGYPLASARLADSVVVFQKRFIEEMAPDGAGLISGSEL